MKRNLVTVSIFIILALAVILVIKSKNRLRRAASPNPTLIQENGTWTVRQPQAEVQPIIIATLPETNAVTNRAPSSRKKP